ncbi:MAG: alkaline phosphatase family protein [Acidobacteria bacterium]|nr:alkaline phosphatase family protein [Acidobacteriota bacterium]
MISAVLSADAKPAAAVDARRVLFVSLDGLGYQNLTSNPVTSREMKTLRRLAKRGFLAPMQTTFPSKTAAGHAALFTGAWGGVNGIYSNTNPRLGHALTDTISGYRSESLTADPIWTTASNQGVSSVAYQATQMYPFNERSTGSAVTLNGYQSWTMAPARVISAKDLKDPDEWIDGPLRFTIRREPQGLRIGFGEANSSVLVRHVPTETAGPRKRPLARHFSEPLTVEANGIRTAVYFRLFEYSPNDFLLYRTAAQEAAAHGLTFDLAAETGPFVPNSATSLYTRGAFGKRLADGGDGTAERRYLETFELVVRQETRQMLALDRHLKPRLFVGYYPVVDDMEHTWFGLSGTGFSAIDAYRAWGFAALDEGLAQLVKPFLHRRDIIVFASDHGMAANTHEVRMPILLRDLGFDNKQVVANATCLFVNSTSWKQGTVEPLAKSELVKTLQSKLAATGYFTRFYLGPEMAARYGHRGPTAPELCFDLKPGYYFSEASRGKDAVVPYPHPRGEHGFDPLRPEMQSYVLISGVKLRSHPMARQVDGVPTIEELLGIRPAASVQGVSLLHPSADTPSPSPHPLLP